MEGCRVDIRLLLSDKTGFWRLRRHGTGEVLPDDRRFGATVAPGFVAEGRIPRRSVGDGEFPTGQGGARLPGALPCRRPDRSHVQDNPPRGVPADRREETSRFLKFSPSFHDSSGARTDRLAVGIVIGPTFSISRMRFHAPFASFAAAKLSRKENVSYFGVDRSYAIRVVFRNIVRSCFFNSLHFRSLPIGNFCSLRQVRMIFPNS
mmetsp:Transcript_23043/g.52744  ORF Transcript_23043/g.52744 Transcript_23043/m.52744 type:complete len:206 (+) Transcript_23043:223-840(+)